jgi:hypothetical protein
METAVRGKILYIDMLFSTPICYTRGRRLNETFTAVWWYFSPRFRLDVKDGETEGVVVDLSRRDSTLARFFVLMFTPWRAVALSSGTEG